MQALKKLKSWIGDLELLLKQRIMKKFIGYLEMN